MIPKIRYTFCFLLIPVLVFLMSGCSTPVRSLKSDPGKYAESEVRVTGLLTDRRRLPFFSAEVLEITDDGFTAFIVRDRNAEEIPKMYKKITVKGKVYYLNADDPAAKASLRRALHVKVASLTAGTPFQAADREITSALADLIELADSLSPSTKYPPTVIIIEERK